MTEKIRVLYVDDESVLLELCKMFLERSGDFTVAIATSAPEAIRILGQERFDTIVSDYQMPEMDGIEFLKHLKSEGNTTPFIIFTGKGREEVMIEALNAGADGYLQKGCESKSQFAELSHKIKQAASRKIADDSLKRSEEKYRHLIEHSNEAIVVVQDGMLKMVNHRTVEFTGCSEQELLSMSFLEFIHPDDRAMVVERYQKRMKGGELPPSRYTFRLSSKDASIIWVEISVAAIDWDGSPATLNFLTDITERKQAEDALHESEEKFRSLVEHALEGILILDLQGTILFANNATARTLEADDRAGLIGRNVMEFIAPESREDVVKDFIEASQGHDAYLAHYNAISAKGNKFTVESIGKVISYEGKPADLISIRDITERKQTEDALRQSESKYKQLVMMLTEGIWVIDRDATTTFVNPTMATMLGYTPDEMIGKPVYAFTPPELHESAKQGISSAQNEKLKQREICLLKKDGTKIHALMETAEIRDADGKYAGGIAAVIDITERKRAEEALRESEARFRVLAENSSDIIQILDHEGRIVFDTAASKRLLGYSNGFTIGRNPDEFIHPDDLAMGRKKLSDVYARTDTGVPTEFRIRRADGSYTWVESFGKNLIGVLGVDGVVITTRFIDDRKKVEEALRESENQYRTLVESSTDNIFIIDRDDIVRFVNSYAAGNLHLPADEIIGKPRKNFFHLDIADMQGMNLQKVFETGEPFREEDKILYGNQEFWQDTTLVPLKDETGNITAVLGVSRDITDRKRVQKALAESESFNRGLVENLPDYIAIYGPAGNILHVNPASATVLGYSEEKLVGTPVLSYVAEEYRDEVVSRITDRQEGGEVPPYEIDLLTHGGLRRSVIVKGTQIQYRDTPATLLVLTDITERKRAEETLRASEQRYRDVVEDQTEFICRFLPDGSLTFINEAYCNYFQLNREECIGKRHSAVLPPEDAQQMKKHLAALTPENPVLSISHRIVMPSGEVRWQRWSDRAIFDKEGDVIEYQSVGRDITSQKEIEIQLENYKETLEQRVSDRTSELSETNLKLKKEIEDRKKIQKKLTLSSNEKDLLLREVHHRVKNNLQLIIGLIDITKKRAHEPAVLSTLTDIMAKVQTMGSIHTRLYESKRFDKINMKRQVHDLVEMISGFYDHDHLDITINIDCAEIYLPVDQAIPCALALNEILSNIHKHAFSGRRYGLVEISSSKKDDNLCFIIRDNGIGLPSGFDIEKSNRLGLKLMRTLVEQQLHGNVQITSKAGTEVMIEFPINQGELDFGTGTGS